MCCSIPLTNSLVVTHALDWPTLTVEWFPDIETPAGKDYTIQRILIGTHTAEGEQNYLQIAQVQLPNEQIQPKQADSVTGGTLISL